VIKVRHGIKARSFIALLLSRVLEVRFEAAFA